MALWWLVYNTPKGPSVRIQEAFDFSMARLKAAMAGAPDDFKEGHVLDARTARKVPKAMVDRMLSARQAKKLLKKLG